MKKSIISLISVIAVLLLMAACHSEEIKQTSGKIKHLNQQELTLTVGDYDIQVNIEQVRYDNGAVMPGDSVVVHYVGDLREKRVKGVLVKLIPAKGTVVEAGYDPTKELKIRHLDPEKQKAFDEFVEADKARRAAKGKNK